VAVLGIDAGGTQTTCILADERGHPARVAHGPGANLQSSGEAHVSAVLEDVIQRALGGEQPEAICLGMAGVDRPHDAEIVRRILTRLYGSARIVVVNDALIALEAGIPGGAGTVLIAGTGSIAYGRDRDGRGARAGGWGYVLGDEGSGYWLGRLALRAVVRAADGRGMETALTPRVLRHYAVERPRDLVRKIYEGGTHPGAIAALAREVGAAADEGDPTALHLILLASQELVTAAASVAKRLGIENEPVVLSGGTLLGLSRLKGLVLEELSRVLPDAQVWPLATEPARGAVHLATRAVEGTLRVPAYEDGL
jgi:N-acetylglucosamine kinase-like BadF-type ATPase